MPEFHRRSRIDASAARVFEWHTRPGAFDRLIPPWENLRVLKRPASLRDGETAVFELRVGPFRTRWVAEHSGFVDGVRFDDRQTQGPFAVWEHEHRFEPDGEGCYLEDRLFYQLPFGRLGRSAGHHWIERRLEELFAFRHERTRADLARHDRFASAGRRTVLVTGASGLIGSALVPFLSAGGHEVRTLTRGPADPTVGRYSWNPSRGEIDAEALDGVDAVVHLAGESVAGGRWTRSRRRAIRESRTRGTNLLSEAIARSARGCRVLVSASAVGYYGDRGDETLTEDSRPGRGFLAEVAAAWEEATRPAADAGIRVARLRIGLVVSRRGGALPRLLPLFRLGLGGPFGSGRQHWSWIALDDLVGILHQAILDPALEGPINAVAPEPVTAGEFAALLGETLERPAILHVPEMAIRMFTGEMGQSMLLSSARVLPTRLEALRFPFLHRTLRDAFLFELGRIEET